jgi:hypothetical protein
VAEDRSDDVIPLSRFRAAVARPRGYRQLESLLSAADPDAAIAALSVPELFFLVREVGFADAQELIQLSTPEQLRGCIDMDAWDRDHLEAEALLPWLNGVLEAGFEKLGQVWDALDSELTALILQRLTEIYDLSLGELPPDDEERPILTTPDTFLAVVLTGEREEEVALAHRIVEDLYRANPDLARHTLMTARSELPSELEEMSYRWRSGRMADLGYVDFYEALEVFRPLDPSAILIDEYTAAPPPPPLKREGEGTSGHLPALIIERVVGRTFLARVLDGVVESEVARRLEAELLYLVNRVLAAARVSPGDEEAVRVGSEHAAATLSLGLEQIAGGDPTRGRAALDRVSLTRLHRVGYTLTLRVARHARVLAPRATGAGAITDAVLAALLGSRPFFATALDDGRSTRLRPFETVEDLRKVATHLSELALRIAIADVAGAPHRRGPEDPDLDAFARTALLRSLAGGEFAATPLQPREVIALRRQILASGRIPDATRSRAASIATDRLERARVPSSGQLLPRLLDRWFAELEQVFLVHRREQGEELGFLDGIAIPARDDAD